MNRGTRNQRITHLEFGFENVEGARFDARIIHTGSTGKVKEEFFIQRDSVTCFATTDKVEFRFEPDMFDKENVDLSKMHNFHNSKEEALEDVKNHFRLFHDIVDINFVYEDGSEENIYVPWPGEDDTINHGMKFYEDKDGLYVLLIEETEN